MQAHGMTDDGQAQNIFKTLEKVPKNCVESHERISGLGQYMSILNS